ncbi:MAG: DUF3604 domain-containing protein [Myxococcales bacterium]|nr:DUF3604 domain-containing protein [Myxococcales bacterium]
MNCSKARLVNRKSALGLALVLAGVTACSEEEPRLPEFEVTEAREVCIDRDALRKPFFGDTHVHTAYSFDARSQNTLATPRDAYRFAKGETIGLQPYNLDGTPMRTVKIARPLDWTAVTDHSEMLGEVRSCYTEGKPGYDSDACWFIRNLGPLAMISATRTLLGRQRFNFCGESGELCSANHREAWRDIQDAAEEAYDRTPTCSFTSFVGYEWTASVGNGENLHRNVIFRNAQVPSYALSWVDTPSAYDLWLGLERDCVEGVPGCAVLTIPHNSNISGDGLMFASGKLRTTADGGLPVDAEEAVRRQKYEPLVEIMQHKGDSECLLGGDTVDEACAFEKLDYDSFAGVQRMAALRPGGEVPKPKRSAMVREALKKGLLLQERLGTNPLKFGIIASTDTHLGAPGLVMEYDSKGHGGAGMSSATAMPVGLPDNIEFNPGGLAVVWAEENSRDSIFSALERKETYGTSGTRPVVRFFGGWDYDDSMCGGDDFVKQGYRGGVPMGGDLQASGGGDAPVFAVSAFMDPGTAAHPGTALQRIQIVKGWVENGEAHETVVDVAGGENGASVDPSTCRVRGTGEASLCSVWTDPDFDPNERAFYYARVLENPTCRWSQQLCVEAGVVCSDPSTVTRGYEPCCAPDHRPVIQERAWTSPVWYSP